MPPRRNGYPSLARRLRTRAPLGLPPRPLQTRPPRREDLLPHLPNGRGRGSETDPLRPRQPRPMQPHPRRLQALRATLPPQRLEPRRTAVHRYTMPRLSPQEARSGRPSTPSPGHHRPPTRRDPPGAWPPRHRRGRRGALGAAHVCHMRRLHRSPGGRGRQRRAVAHRRMRPLGALRLPPGRLRSGSSAGVPRVPSRRDHKSMARCAARHSRPSRRAPTTAAPVRGAAGLADKEGDGATTRPCHGDPRDRRDRRNGGRTGRRGIPGTPA